jgi:hypothetical protein
VLDCAANSAGDVCAATRSTRPKAVPLPDDQALAL